MLSGRYMVIYLLSILSLVGCKNTDGELAMSIIMQLPDQERKVLVPNDLAVQLKNNHNIISFADIDILQSAQNMTFTEVEFYEYVRALDVQYIIVSSEMISDSKHNFPWITNKNFRACPGVVDHNTLSYYTLLVWDNAKDSYHFFKFIYGERS